MAFCLTSDPKPAPKVDILAPTAKKKGRFRSFLKGILKGKWKAPKTTKISKISSLQPWGNHSNVICAFWSKLT
jgi:hypothetical protein